VWEGPDELATVVSLSVTKVDAAGGKEKKLLLFEIVGLELCVRERERERESRVERSATSQHAVWSREKWNWR